MDDGRSSRKRGYAKVLVWGAHREAPAAGTL